LGKRLKRGERDFIKAPKFGPVESGNVTRQKKVSIGHGARSRKGHLFEGRGPRNQTCLNNPFDRDLGEQTVRR